MGIIDTVTKEYIKNNRIFADIFNQFLYQGEPVIVPEKLQPLDTNVTAVFEKEQNKKIPLQKNRDIFKALAMKEQDGIKYLLLGVEAQAYVSTVMPVRSMMYDVIEYENQIGQIAARHKEERKSRKKGLLQSDLTKEESQGKERLEAGEFLSGFWKDDHLSPVITLVLYLGTEKWWGPVSLHEMMQLSDESMKSWIADYKINLVTPEQMSDQEIDRYHTSMREVMRYLKYSNDKDKIKEILHTYPEYQSLEKTAAHVIQILTNTKAVFEGKYIEEEKVNMCKAIDDWMEEAKMEGRAEGRIEEQKNTARERDRADAAETRAKEAEKENQRLKLLLKEMGYCF